jgi:Putative MetA-pathway of phenol degradation
VGSQLDYRPGTRVSVIMRWCALAAAAAFACNVAAQEDVPYRQSREDAWWTGPILAPSANTLPRGHWLVEPYFFDVMSRGHYDTDGRRQKTERTHTVGSFTYINYGLRDRFTIGAVPRFSFNDVNDGQDSSGVRVGDLSLQAQYRLTQFVEGSRIPTLALNVQQTFPTGRYDRLGARPSDGVGSGAYTTTLSIYSQHFLWMPNGRIMRTRLNLSYALSDDVDIEDVSVYGTGEGFRGTARTGESFVANSAWEYSMTRNWVLALDINYQHDSSTRIRGFDPAPVELNTGSRETLTLAPAVEYNWNSRMGVIVGTVFTATGRNAGATLVPVAAVNMVF